MVDSLKLFFTAETQSFYSHETKCYLCVSVMNLRLFISSSIITLLLVAINKTQLKSPWTAASAGVTTVAQYVIPAKAEIQAPLSRQ